MVQNLHSKNHHKQESKTYKARKRRINLMDEIITIKEACPICHGDVKGNDKTLYFCQTCNLLFAKHHLDQG